MRVDASLVAAKPAAVSHAAAAALGVSGATTIAALEKACPIKAGQKVLIHAAAGGVGSISVQFAASVGAVVLGTASARNADWVKALGARDVIDYTAVPFEEAATDCDVVFDTVGGDVFARSFKALKPGGTLVYINSAPIPDTTPPRDDVTVVNAFVKTDGARMRRIAELADAGVIKAPVEETFPFDHWREAYAICESGHARGKVVLQMK
jgi:NADPH:quinone reductase-like Zn-dependent oxidoreductase